MSLHDYALDYIENDGTNATFDLAGGDNRKGDKFQVSFRATHAGDSDTETIEIWEAAALVSITYTVPEDNHIFDAEAVFAQIVGENSNLETCNESGWTARYIKPASKGKGKGITKGKGKS